MKKIITIFLAIFCFYSVYAQTQEYRTITWDNLERNYIEISPSEMTSAKPVLFVLHGMGDSDTSFVALFTQLQNLPDWYYIFPQALNWSIMGQEMGSTWNISASGTISGMLPYDVNGDVDDDGFFMAILDSLINNCSIDQDSIFFAGFSLGGFMANKMGILHADRINGIASISGTIGNELGTNVPLANVNALHIHGDADNVVDYETGEATIQVTVPIGSTGAEGTVEFWRNFNNCDTENVHYSYPDTENDNLTFERDLYLNGDNDSRVGFIKVNGGAHEFYYYPQNDIDYFAEVIKFFKNQWNEEDPIGINNNSEANMEVFPNPASTTLNVYVDELNTNLEIYNLLGEKVYESKLTNYENSIDISSLTKGAYIVKTNNTVKNIIIQ